MSRIILATSTNEGYYHVAKKYLTDIQKHSDLENECLCIDFPIPACEGTDFYNTHFIHVKSKCLRVPLNNWCIQHGEFCDYITGSDDDVILFTDADLRMQRPFKQEELDMLRALRPGQVMAGYNAGPTDTLYAEATRLGPLVSPKEVMEEFGNLIQPCYNVGCVAADRNTWEQICDLYVDLWPAVKPMFTHVAKQQWLISWILNRYFEVEIMPVSFHAHAHYGIPAGCTYRGGIVCFDAEPVLFRHKFER